MALACVVLAGVLWLSASSSSRAATATQTQGVAAAVASTISWGSVTGCTQNMPTADFGTLAAGANSTLTGFTGCVTSNASWSVGARMSTPLTSTNDGTTIDGSALKLTNSAVPGAPANNKCVTATPCTLAASPTTDTTIISGAPRGGKQFDYSLGLTVPGAATGGTYVNGTLTFTASN